MINRFNYVTTNFSLLKEIAEEDLIEVINIRTNHSNSVLSPISHSLQDQVNYYEKYRECKYIDGEIYYSIFNLADQKNIIGFVRITQLVDLENFCWESFILKNGVAPHFAYDIMMAIFSIGFDYFNKEKCGPWRVPSAASNIMEFHRFAGMAEKVNSDDQYHYLHVTKQAYLNKIGFFRSRKLGVINSHG